MSELIGIDWSATFADLFGGQLTTATFVRKDVTGYNPADPTGAPTTTDSSYQCEAIAWAYDERFVDGEKVFKGDYRVTILVGSIVAVANDAVEATLDLDPLSPNADTIIAARLAGAAGNQITVELVGDALAAAGTIAEVGTNIRLGFLPGSTTVAQLEALLATSALVEVGTPGTAGNVLAVGDELAATPLAGGVNATMTQAPGVVPRPGDTISVPPPGQTTPKPGRVVGPGPVTAAFVTVQVRGEPM